MNISSTVVIFTSFVLGAVTMYAIFMTVFAMRKDNHVTGKTEKTR